ncbi:MAG: hypothetical protein IKQ81_02210 [Clostridiales bacterium]|nr:hypothetical protein [Clostridiales bacterium]
MAINNRLVKLITISAGACLILGSLAGCKPAEEPEATAAASEAQEESETETEAPQASVATSDTEDPAESDPSADFVIEPEYIELDSEEQKYVNTYITNFVEQYFFDFDSDSATAEQLLDFVHIHLKINAYDQISYETKGDITFETFTVSEATKVISKYFALYFTEDDCKALPAPPETYGDQPAGPFYEDGKIWYEAADGESYNLIGIVDSVLNNTDGTLTLEFTIYSIDYEVYNELDMDGIAAYYSMTPEQAAADSTLTRVKTGTAVVTNAQSGDYLLISYGTN